MCELLWPHPKPILFSVIWLMYLCRTDEQFSVGVLSVYRRPHQQVETCVGLSCFLHNAVKKLSLFSSLGRRRSSNGEALQGVAVSRLMDVCTMWPWVSTPSVLWIKYIWHKWKLRAVYGIIVMKRTGFEKMISLPMVLFSHQARSSFMGSRLASWRYGSHWLYSWGQVRPGPLCLYFGLRRQSIPNPVRCLGLDGPSRPLTVAASSMSMVQPACITESTMRN